MNKYMHTYNPLNLYRIIALLCVFCLHTSIFSSSLGFSFDEKTWFLATPAWAAVWMFFILSGYLIGNGFYSGRYKDQGRYTLKSSVLFVWNRFLKVGIPTWCFSILSIIILDPAFFIDNKFAIIKIFTFTYKNNPASNIIGATWYVSTLMWLYLCAPLLCYLIEKIYSIKVVRKYGILFFLMVVLGGVVLRLYLFRKGLEWSGQVYVPFYCNLDIYICGILLNYVPEFSFLKSAVLRFLSLLLLLFLIVSTSRLYYLGTAVDAKYLTIYQYCMPSVYIIVTSVFLVFNNKYNGTKRRIIYVIIDFLAEISFEFYLVHSMVLNSIYPYISASSTKIAHLKLMLIAFVISMTLSFLMKRAFRASKRG